MKPRRFRRRLPSSTRPLDAVALWPVNLQRELARRLEVLVGLGYSASEALRRAVEQLDPTKPRRPA